MLEAAEEVLGALADVLTSTEGSHIYSLAQGRASLLVIEAVQTLEAVAIICKQADQR